MQKQESCLSNGYEETPIIASFALAISCFVVDTDDSFRATSVCDDVSADKITTAGIRKTIFTKSSKGAQTFDV